MDDAAGAPHREADIFIPVREFRDLAREALEKERLWPKVWQMACRESELPKAGDFVRYDILDDTILIVRTGDGADKFAAFYNVCQHRGRRLVDEDSGNLGAGLTCRFHGWRYGISGELLGVYAEDDWAGCPSFDKSKLSIPAIKVARWGGWVWINQDLKAEPFETWIAPIADKLASFDLPGLRPVWWATILADVNWKVVVEAFIEGYHAGTTHICGLNYNPMRSPTAVHGAHSLFYSEMLSFFNYRDQKAWVKPKTFQEHLWASQRHLFDSLKAMTLAPGMAAFDRVRDLPVDMPTEEVMAKAFDYQREELERYGAAWPEGMTLERWLTQPTDYNIFPNSVTLPTIDGALWYRVRPHREDRDKCVFDIWSFGRFAPGAEPAVEHTVHDGFANFRGNNEFLEEDFSNMEAVNEGMKCRGFRGAVINPAQEATVAHFRRTLARYLDAEPS